MNPRARLYVADLIRQHLKRVDDASDKVWGDGDEPTADDIALDEDFPDALRADIEAIAQELES